MAIHQGVSNLARRTWGTSQFTSELELHLQWWRGYYHLARYHESLGGNFPTYSGLWEATTTPLPNRTPAMATRLTSHRGTVLELISYPLS